MRITVFVLALALAALVGLPPSPAAAADRGDASGSPMPSARASPSPASPAPRPPDPRLALPRPQSWTALLAESRAGTRPIVLMFSTPGCPWCERLRRDHLRHLARDQHRLGVIVAELDLLDREPLADGRTPAAIAGALGVRVAPTVLFLGPDGELAERLVGYQSADFYGAYLDERIAEAAAKLR